MKTIESRKDILIEECYEPLLEIPRDGRYVFTDPHPYEILGAPYNGTSPFLLRKNVLNSLLIASEILEKKLPGYRFKIHDAYRPFVVQEFMVNYMIEEYCRKTYNILLSEASKGIYQEAEYHAYKIFAKPNKSYKSPPPHSTGAAIDLTIVDSKGEELPMGSLIDGEKFAHPDSFKHSREPKDILFHNNRLLLREIMERSGFKQLPHEWWHFSQGDQTALFIEKEQDYEIVSVAKYGRIDM